jgi:dihydrofolate reductase
MTAGGNMPTSVEGAPASKKMLGVGGILSSLPVLLFVFTGMFSLLKAEWMNNLPKVVFSKTLKKVEWKNSRLVSTSIPEEVSELKQQAGTDIIVLGSAKLASFLLQLRLVDEYRVIVNPVLLGKGRPLFADITERIRLKLLATKVLAPGVVILSYERA